MAKLTETRGYNIELTEQEARVLLGILGYFDDDTLVHLYELLRDSVDGVKLPDLQALGIPGYEWKNVVALSTTRNPEEHSLASEAARVDDRISIDDLKDPKKLYGKG